MGSEQSCHKRRVSPESQPGLKKARVDSGYHRSVATSPAISIGSPKPGASTEEIRILDDHSNSMDSTDALSLISRSMTSGSSSPDLSIEEQQFPNSDAQSNSTVSDEALSSTTGSPTPGSPTPGLPSPHLSIEELRFPNARSNSIVSNDAPSPTRGSSSPDLSTEELHNSNAHTNTTVNNDTINDAIEQVLELLRLLSVQCEFGCHSSRAIGPSISPGSIIEKLHIPKNRSQTKITNDAVEKLLDLLRALSVKCEFEQLKNSNSVLYEENTMFKNMMDAMRKELTDSSTELREKIQTNSLLENIIENMRNKTLETVAAKEALAVQLKANYDLMNRKLSDIIGEQRKLFKQSSLIMQKELCDRHQTIDDRRNLIRSLRSRISELMAEKETKPIQMRARYDRIIGELGNIIGQQRKLIKQAQSTSTSE